MSPRFFLAFRALCLALLLPAQVWALEFPAVGVWNGFNGHLNVLECANGSSHDGYRLEVDVKSNDGALLGTVPLNLAPRATKHLVLNDFGITDAYGTVVIRNTEEMGWNYASLLCHTAFYRLTTSGSDKAIEYAFSIPVGLHQSGWETGVFNSMNPSGGSNPVQNWLTVYNNADSPFSATVHVWDQEGNYSDERTFRIENLPPGQRHDYALGHEQGQVVGSFQIAPDGSSNYAAFVTRYSPSDSGHFNFAFPLVPNWGHSDSGAVPASTMDPADNWAEIANPNWEGVSALIEVRNGAGELIHEEERHIPAHSQSHLYLNQFLGPRAVGTFRVRSVNGTSSLIVESLYYGHRSESDSRIEWAYASQASGEETLYSWQRYLAPINTFLGASNWTKYLSTDTSSHVLETSYNEPFGGTMVENRRVVGAEGSVDIDAHRIMGYDRVGASVTRIREEAKVSAEHIRVFPRSDGGIGYIMNIAPVAVYDWSNDGDWSAPLGVPEPEFGIREEAPAMPTSWDSDQARFYYVDAASANCRDEGYGFPASPRCSIPSDLLAGSVVEIHGVYPHSHVGSSAIVAHGTVAAPVYIRGSSADERALVTAPLEVRGSSYLIVENLEFADADGDLTGGVSGSFAVGDSTGAGAASDSIALRHCELRGNKQGGGVTLGGTAGAVMSNLVLWDNIIHDNGDWQSASALGVHGVSIRALVQGAWIVDNYIYRNGGSGVEINGEEADRRNTYDIFVGRNTVYQNRMSGLWSKQSTDVVFAENTVFDQRASESAPGAGLGFELGPDRIWFLFNHVYNSNFGILGDHDAGTSGDGYYGFLIGNIIHDVRSATAFASENPESDGQAVLIRGLESIFFVNNTVYGTDGGIGCLAGTRCYFSNNSVSHLATGARHITVIDSYVANQSTLQNNLVYQPGASARISWGGATYDGLSAFSSATGQGSACMEADPALESPETLDFTPSQGSPLVDAGLDDVVYQTYYERYGVWIRRDQGGTYRPVNGVVDIGAFEFSS